MSGRSIERPRLDTKGSSRWKFRVEAKLRNWANVFAVFRDADYEVRGLSVAVGDDVAFGHCFGRLHGTLMNGMATKSIWVRVTFCFRKLDGAWHRRIGTLCWSRGGESTVNRILAYSCPYAVAGSEPPPPGSQSTPLLSAAGPVGVIERAARSGCSVHRAGNKGIGCCPPHRRQ